jgi:hypothetical protein
MTEPMDDLDLEVSHLVSASTTPTPKATNSDDVTPITTSAALSEPPTRHISLAARRPRGQQLVRGGSVIVLLTLLIVAALLVPTSNRDTILRTLTPPTPSPTTVPLPGEGAFLWEHSAPWGRLLIDHKPGPDVSGWAVSRSAEGVWVGAPFRLPRGRHILEYRAAPFATLDCIVTVPVSSSDTCPQERSLDYGYLIPGAPATRLLDLQATLTRLL